VFDPLQRRNMDRTDCAFNPRPDAWCFGISYAWGTRRSSSDVSL
jgi:hypothetical protein